MDATSGGNPRASCARRALTRGALSGEAGPLRKARAPRLLALVLSESNAARLRRGHGLFGPQPEGRALQVSFWPCFWPFLTPFLRADAGLEAWALVLCQTRAEDLLAAWRARFAVGFPSISSTPDHIADGMGTSSVLRPPQRRYRV